MSRELTLWGGSVLPFDFEQRIAAAHAGGFSSTSLFPFEVARAREAGIDAAQLRERFESAGVRIAVLDPLARWLPTWRAPTLPPNDPAFGDYSAGEMFEMAVALGADLISVLALYDPPVDPALGAPAFAALCDQAGEHGLRLQLEFVPGTGIPDLATAWEIVVGADRANGGLLLDSWHFFRSGSSFELLEQIPRERIFALQVEDAPAAPPPDRARESLHERLLPGEGDLDLARMLACLDGELPPLSGPEVFSDRLWELPPEELGSRLGDSTRALLD